MRDGARIRSVDVICSCMYNCILFFFNPSTMSVNPRFLILSLWSGLVLVVLTVGFGAGLRRRIVWTHWIEHLYITSPFFSF